MSRPSSGPVSRSPRLLGLLVAAILPLAAACQAGSEPSAGPTPSPQPESQVRLAGQPASTKVGIHAVHGRLPIARRKQARAQIGAVVDGWWDAAYLGGEYPRSGFPAAFPGFTDAAEARARADKALMTNLTHGPRITSVTPIRRQVTLDLLATDRVARAATARFLLRFSTEGEKSGTTTVRGRLFLVHKRGAWRVFGYDVAKGARP